MGVIDNFVHLFAPLTANCRDFNGLWERASTPAADSVGGRWEGEWISAASSHRGRLRCVVEPQSDARWKMWFRGEYGGVFRACYSTDFTVAWAGDRWTFSGGSNLGALAGGAYTYSGSADHTTLTCNYRSAKDHGVFRLKKLDA
jgi:hypothetical protein